MSSPKIKKMKRSLLSLPDDLIFSCIARVSRLYYPTLSLVSKRFRSLLASPELYKTRSLLNNTESCLYVCLKLSPNDFCWFTLCKKPNHQTLTDNMSSGYVLTPLPVQRSTPTKICSLLAVGSDIYNIAESSSFCPFSKVSVLDCTSHTWREAPSLPVKLLSLYASSVNQKIYVGGSYFDEDSSSWKNYVQVLDTKTQIWDHVPIPRHELGHLYIGKFHLNTEKKVVTYNSREGRWDLVDPKMRNYMSYTSCCHIQNVLYSIFHGVIEWYDAELRMWKCLRGLVGLPKFNYNVSVKLVDYAGKIAVFWTKKYNEIWCAEISLKKHNNCEIWGEVKWSGHVLTIPTTCPIDIVKVLATTV